MRIRSNPAHPTGLTNHLLTEDLVYFADVARRFPEGDGRGMHVGTLNRWRDRGVAGVRLEAVRVGGRWMTSWQAVDRFVTALNAARPSAPAPTTSAASRPRAAVERQLDAEGL